MGVARTVPDGICYLCGLPGESMTKEHVVSRTLYDNKTIPNDGGHIVLPAHRECNVSTSWDETWIATTYAVTQTVENRRQEIWDRALRGLVREDGKATGFRNAFFDSIVFSESEGGPAIRMDRMRLGYVLAKIAKGFVYAECDLLLDDRYRWMWTQLTPDEFMKAPPALRSRNVHDLVFATWHLSPDRESFLCWIVMREANCHLIAARTHQAWGDRLEQTEALPWPRPKDGQAAET